MPRGILRHWIGRERGRIHRRTRFKIAAEKRFGLAEACNAGSRHFAIGVKP